MKNLNQSLKTLMALIAMSFTLFTTSSAMNGNTLGDYTNNVKTTENVLSNGGEYAPSSTPQEALRNLETYINTQDMKGILSLYHDNGVFVNQPEGAILKGDAEISAGFQGFFDLGGQADIQLRNMIRSGDLALMVVDWTFAGTDSEGNAYKFGATATDVLQQDENGNWYYKIDNAFGVAKAENKANSASIDKKDIALSSTTPRGVLKKLETYLNTKDMKGMMSLFHEEGVLVNQPEATPLTGYDAISGGFQGFFDMGGKADINVRNVISAGDIALVIVDWTYGGIGADGKPYEFGATATDVLERDENGNWLYRIDNAFGVAKAN